MAILLPLLLLFEHVLSLDFFDMEKAGDSFVAIDWEPFDIEVSAR
jgi:hypothetical protein